MAVPPLRPALHLGAFAFILTRDDYARQHRADWDLGIRLRREGLALLLKHIPAPILVIRAVWIEIVFAERRDLRLPVLRKTKHGDRPDMVLTDELEVIGIDGAAGLVPISGLIARIIAQIFLARLVRGRDILAVDMAEQAAARRLPLPHIDDAAIDRVVEAALIDRPRLVGRQRIGAEIGRAGSAERRGVREDDGDLVLVVIDDVLL